MRIFVIAVCVALATARPEAGGGYRYSSPLLPISGAGPGLAAGPCCQQLSQIKGGLHGGGLVGGPGAGGFASGGGFGHGLRHGSAPAPALIATPTPVTFTAPAPGIGYSHGSSGFSSFSGHGAGGSIGIGGGLGHGAGLGLGHGIGGGIGPGIGSGVGPGIGGGIGQGVAGGFGHGSGVGIGSGGFVPSAGGPGIGGGAGGFVGGAGFSGGSFSSSGVETSASIGAASIPDNSGSTLIQKHIYVHVPPPDPEEQVHASKITQFAQPRKHYKIIFIKAPTVQAPSAAQIAAANALTEEKTLVYVLVKKPEEPSVEQLQTLQSTVHHHKPEVYFIKYKAKTQPQGPGLGLIDNFGAGGSSIAHGASLAQASAASFASGSASLVQEGGASFSSGPGVALTTNIGAEHNIAIATPSPTPYAPAGNPLIEPRAPGKIIPADTYGPPPDAV
ncbi:unnamed protein product [Hermetia illucens]|uniref:DUF243 domain-containing protein n=1 Tax=Hermetia illucens TaxID=343691 RepID=A0A7R8UNN7_HERIL|nr:unnamed protein product [Hermetia illucens]